MGRYRWVGMILKAQKYDYLKNMHVYNTKIVLKCFKIKKPGRKKYHPGLPAN